MPSEKEIKKRISSIEETKKITNAMYLISSSKMKQARAKLAKTEPFFFAMQRELSRLLCHCPDAESVFFDERPKVTGKDRVTGIIVVTADKGLAGAYNHNVIKAVQHMLKLPESNRLFVLGEVGRHYFETHHDNLELDIDFRYTVQDPSLHRSRRISSRMLDMFCDGTLDEIHIVYTKMENALSTQAEVIQLLPLRRTHFDQQCDVNASRETLSFYPSPEDVINSIVPSYINGIIYGCLVESYCSEQNSRMIAMENATDSAKDMLTELNMTYNRVRQANITQELTEVVAGANVQQRE